MVYTWSDKKNGRIYDEERSYWTMNNDIGTIISVWETRNRSNKKKNQVHLKTKGSLLGKRFCVELHI